MSNYREIVKLINYWQLDAVNSKLFVRSVVSKIDAKSKEVVDIVGPRRAGKSFVLKLLIKNLGLKEGDFLYMNFEDPFFVENNDPLVVGDIIEVYKEYFGKNLKYLFFDEIQNIKSWERSIRALRDGGDYKVFVTGSSSKLLSGELATALTGRHLSYWVFPLSFKEFLDFEGVVIENSKSVVVKENSLKNYFIKYLEMGGFPEVVLSKNPLLLKQYFFDVLEKDIIKRYDIREKEILQKIGVFVITNATKTISLSSLERLYGISSAVVRNYLEYFKEAFLIFELSQFSYSLKTQQKVIKKYYCVDTGLANAVSFRFSEDKGRMLENAAFLHLKDRFDEIYYYKTKQGKEVDFLVKTASEYQLFNVCWDLSDQKTRDREVKSLLEAMDEMGLTTGTIFTFEEEETLHFGEREIELSPLYKYPIVL